jgi:hypothetical protein
MEVVDHHTFIVIPASMIIAELDPGEMSLAAGGDGKRLVPIGKTPISVPIRTPIKQNTRFIGSSAKS